MNLPNKLSIARVLCIPAVVALLHFPSDGCRIAAAVLFILGCLTDFLNVCEHWGWATGVHCFVVTGTKSFFCEGSRKHSVNANTAVISCNYKFFCF